MQRMVATWGEQLRWAGQLAWPAGPSLDQVLICGMGGSGISGDFAAAVCPKPVRVHKAYGLPAWATVSRAPVLAVSYSGNTEETLSAVEAARAAGLRLAAVGSGGRLLELARSEGWPFVEVPIGLQPRAALGYLLGGVLSLLGGWGLSSINVNHLNAAAEVADSIVEKTSPASHEVSNLAGNLQDRIVGVYGSEGLVAPAAQRWKTQINENAKWPAWWSLFPELDHNEVVAWSSLSHITRDRVAVVALRDRDEGPRVAARVRITASVVDRDVSWAGEVWSRGEHPLERIVSLAVMGDLVSLELARLAGVDPVPVDAIEELKQKLAEEPS
jgi:glucose/mannose-6-phosphate isomerase